jgi:hypothetical protein
MAPTIVCRTATRVNSAKSLLELRCIGHKFINSQLLNTLRDHLIINSRHLRARGIRGGQRVKRRAAHSRELDGRHLVMENGHGPRHDAAERGHPIPVVVGRDLASFPSPTAVYRPATEAACRWVREPASNRAHRFAARMTHASANTTSAVGPVCESATSRRQTSAARPSSSASRLDFYKHDLIPVLDNLIMCPAVGPAFVDLTEAAVPVSASGEPQNSSRLSADPAVGRPLHTLTGLSRNNNNNNTHRRVCSAAQCRRLATCPTSSSSYD